MISGEEKKHANMPSTLNFQAKASSFNEDEAPEGPRRREQAHKSFPLPQRPEFQVKDKVFQVENQPLKTEIESKNFAFIIL